jgi:3-methyl-2-oxobutanoate hydroxymethyltransferase
MTARLTVADLRAARGKRQFTMVRTTTWDELEAAERSGVDMVSVPPEMMVDPRFRSVAPTIFAVPGMNFYDLAEGDDFRRWAFRMLRASADAVYCSAGLPTIRALAEDSVPVISHIGLIPSRRTWTGGFRAVGKTAESALSVLSQARALEAAGAFGAEIEVVPAAMAAEIAKRTSLFLVSMGAGTGGDAQYLFAEDMLGENTGHVPRHAKVYRHFAAEYARLQAERVAAFGEFVADVASGAYPEVGHLVATDPAELERFIALADAEPPAGSGPVGQDTP